MTTEIKNLKVEIFIESQNLLIENCELPYYLINGDVNDIGSMYRLRPNEVLVINLKNKTKANKLTIYALPYEVNSWHPQFRSPNGLNLKIQFKVNNQWIDSDWEYFDIDGSNLGKQERNSSNEPYVVTKSGILSIWKNQAIEIEGIKITANNFDHFFTEIILSEVIQVIPSVCNFFNKNKPDEKFEKRYHLLIFDPYQIYKNFVELYSNVYLKLNIEDRIHIENFLIISEINYDVITRYLDIVLSSSLEKLKNIFYPTRGQLISSTAANKTSKKIIELLLTYGNIHRDLYEIYLDDVTPITFFPPPSKSIYELLIEFLESFGDYTINIVNKKLIIKSLFVKVLKIVQQGEENKIKIIPGGRLSTYDEQGLKIYYYKFDTVFRDLYKKIAEGYEFGSPEFVEYAPDLYYIKTYRFETAESIPFFRGEGFKALASYCILGLMPGNYNLRITAKIIGYGIRGGIVSVTAEITKNITQPTLIRMKLKMVEDYPYCRGGIFIDGVYYPPIPSVDPGFFISNSYFRVQWIIYATGEPMKIFCFGLDRTCYDNYIYEFQTPNAESYLYLYAKEDNFIPLKATFTPRDNKYKEVIDGKIYSTKDNIIKVAYCIRINSAFPYFSWEYGTDIKYSGFANNCRYREPISLTYSEAPIQMLEEGIKEIAPPKSLVYTKNKDMLKNMNIFNDITIRKRIARTKIENVYKETILFKHLSPVVRTINVNKIINVYSSNHSLKVKIGGVVFHTVPVGEHIVYEERFTMFIKFYVYIYEFYFEIYTMGQTAYRDIEVDLETFVFDEETIKKTYLQHLTKYGISEITIDNEFITTDFQIQGILNSYERKLSKDIIEMIQPRQTFEFDYENININYLLTFYDEISKKKIFIKPYSIEHHIDILNNNAETMVEGEIFKFERLMVKENYWGNHDYWGDNPPKYWGGEYYG